jgi:hypothetical protein
MLPPPDVERGGPSYKAAPNASPPHSGNSAPNVYRCDSRSASDRPLRLIHGDESLAKKLVAAACDDVRSEPSRLPLWCLRLYQHQRLGRLGYQAVWSALYEAGRENGSDKWVRGCLLHAIGQANASTNAPPSMLTLLRGLV